MVKIIMPLSQVYLGMTVTKRTGTKEYTVRDEIRIYGDNPQTIKAEGDTRFLVANDGRITAISGDTEVVWVADLDDAHSYISELRAM